MFLKEINQNTILKLQNAGIAKSEAALETDILLNFVFGVTKKDLILTPDKELSENKLETFNALIDRRIKEKIPVQYLTNKAYFMGEEFYVDENVLIPRPETEILVEEVLKLPPCHCEADCEQRLKGGGDEPSTVTPFMGSNQAELRRGDVAISKKIIDIGTGSGCIACMLAKNLPDATIFACDISEKALKVAEFNAEKLGIKNNITFIHSDLFENVDNKFDIIVSNPPYISIQDKQNLQPEVVLHEPHQALFTEDAKGLDFYEKLVFQAKNYLAKNGVLAVEIGIYQAADVIKIFENSGFKEIQIIKDFNNIERIVTGKLRMSS
ncbi:MAG TPA: peptide chain release factor N(5)-glutamine methyltransferase [Cyanobacteria bacterium UBA9971]|nr:peptide chain release factor N(5)-glutamine methyltransferase [Cyanobacteria bacterium UBA9971]